MNHSKKVAGPTAPAKPRISPWTGIAFLALLPVPSCNYIGVKGGIGEYDLSLRTTSIEQEIKADSLSFRLERLSTPGTVLGGGLDSDFMFRDVFSHDDEEEPIDFDPFAFEFFPFLGIHPNFGDFYRMPIRLGPLFHDLDLESDFADFSWFTLGGKFTLNPELVLVRSTVHAEEISLFTEAGAFGGVTFADANLRGAPSDPFEDESFTGSMIGYGAEAGVRYRLSFFEVRGSVFYRWFRHDRATISDEEEDDFFVSEPSIDPLQSDFTGVAVTIGFYF